MQDAPPQPVRLVDYQPSAYLIDTVDLHFSLTEGTCTVRSELMMRRNPQVPPAPLVLDGQELELVEIALGGTRLEKDAYRVDASHLTLFENESPAAQEPFCLTIVTQIEPHKNTALEGLYRSGDLFCTQCEAEGFRKITYYLDRPDVMAKFTTTIEAERARCPVLLSNGNPIEHGENDEGRHWVTWEDPFPKPAYLFALVAGNLSSHDDRFTTRSGREVDLKIYVEPHNIDKCAHAMDSLKRSMTWDEDVYGLEYDLDIFMIVAVDTFNMGAMENKGLNVFNSKYVLADPATATDTDYRNIEAIIAHEYFHNWTGNRVTCRDWFQLSLKEGLTVFRDQQFSADMGSAGLTRIGDARVLRTAQFREDAGPTAHPVRPHSYFEINNFYTVTVYNKGAEVVRMIHRLLGPVRFRAGIDLYFERHDGQAVTTDDFVAAMEGASGIDLSQFRRWYEQAGTPTVTVETEYAPEEQRFTLHLSQATEPSADGSPKEPFHIPISVGLLQRDGTPIALPGADRDTGTVTLELTTSEASFEFQGIPTAPVASVLREFSAPVKLSYQRDETELAFLQSADSDPFNRWDAGQTYATALMLRNVERHQSGLPFEPDPAFSEALRAILSSEKLDRALAAEMLILPSESYLAESMDIIDPDALHAVRQHLRRVLATELRDELFSTYRACKGNAPYRFETGAVADRSLKNAALGLLMELDDEEVHSECEAQFGEADNMTDRIAALSMLAERGGQTRADVLARFEQEWEDDPLVLDKWFTLQAMSSRPETLGEVQKLLAHPKFEYTNPNRVRALIGAFCHGNQVRFHDRTGEGYRFLSNQLVVLDRLNPQVAARLAGAFLPWRKFDVVRAREMEVVMRDLLEKPGLSNDCLEILSKALSASP